MIISPSHGEILLSLAGLLTAIVVGCQTGSFSLGLIPIATTLVLLAMGRSDSF